MWTWSHWRHMPSNFCCAAKLQCVASATRQCGIVWTHLYSDNRLWRNVTCEVIEKKMNTQNFVKMAPPVSMWEASVRNLWDTLCMHFWRRELMWNTKVVKQLWALQFFSDILKQNDNCSDTLDFRKGSEGHFDWKNFLTAMNSCSGYCYNSSNPPEMTQLKFPP